jgi:hypothetical protein
LTTDKERNKISVMPKEPKPIDLDRELMTEPERIEEDRVLKLETELAHLGPGAQIIIERLRPSWCKGQLEKLTVGEEGIDLDYLIRTWGGQLLSLKIIGPGNRIRGSHSVELYTYEPRRRGKILREPGYDGDEEDDTAPQVVLSQAPAPPPNNDAMFKMLELYNGARQSEVETLRLIVQSQIEASGRTQSPAAMGFGEMFKMLAGFRKMQDLFQRDEPAPIDPDGAFPQQVMDLLGMFIQSKNGDNAKNVITGPAQVRRPQQLATVSPLTGPVQRPASTTPAPAPAPQAQNENLATQIAALNPREAAAVLLDALASMPPDRKNQAIAAVFQEFENLEGAEQYYEDDPAAVDDDPAGNQGVKQGSQ